MPFIKLKQTQLPHSRKRVRVSRAVSKLHRELKKTQEKLDQAVKCKRMFQKRWQRLKNKAEPKAQTSSPLIGKPTLHSNMLILPSLPDSPVNLVQDSTDGLPVFSSSAGAAAETTPTRDAASNIGLITPDNTADCCERATQHFSANLQGPEISTTKTPRSRQTDMPTPETKTKLDIREAGLTPRKLPSKLRKKLLYANTIQKELTDAMSVSRNHKKVVTSILAGKYIKRCRMEKTTRHNLGISRWSVSIAKNKAIVPPKKNRLLQMRQTLEKQVEDFLLRDDNSRQNPGKQDFVTVNGEKKQSRILNDYLMNLYDKFVAETPNIRICRAVFYRMRPKHILLTSFLKSSNCLCQIHQNTALLLKSLKKAVQSTVTLSPDTFIKKKATDESVREVLEEIDESTVTLEAWKRITDPKDKKIKTKIVSTVLGKEEFKEKATSDINKFREHAERVKIQYTEVRKLKDNLPPDQLLLQMDFAENYSCAESNENVQSSYWNQTGVTLHPVVVYFKEATDKDVKHKSFVYVSPALHHNSSMVLAILKILIKKDLHDLIQEKKIKAINYITDSPFSQYRNKFIFFLIANHEELFQMRAIWHYFETGHGKGPCDGVGGSIKRMADLATRQGKCITDADDFMAWALSIESVISFSYVSWFDYTVADIDVKKVQKALVPVKGTVKLHAVRKGDGDGCILWRETSCNCFDCVTEEFPTGCEWNQANITNPNQPILATDSPRGEDKHICASIVCVCVDRIEPVRLTSDETAAEMTTVLPHDTHEKLPVVTEDAGPLDDHSRPPIEEPSLVPTPTLEVGQFVLARYDDDCYVGRIQEIDDDDAFIRFMETKGKGTYCSFIWPKKDDEVWVQFGHIMGVVNEPEAKKRFLKLNSSDQEKFLAAKDALEI